MKTNVLCKILLGILWSFTFSEVAKRNFEPKNLKIDNSKKPKIKKFHFIQKLFQSNSRPSSKIKLQCHIIKTKQCVISQKLNLIDKKILRNLTFPSQLILITSNIHKTLLFKNKLTQLQITPLSLNNLSQLQITRLRNFTTLYNLLMGRSDIKFPSQNKFNQNLKIDLRRTDSNDNGKWLSEPKSPRLSITFSCDLNKCRFLTASLAKYFC